MSWAKQYGDFFKVWVGFELKLFVADPKDIEVRVFRINFRLNERELRHIIRYELSTDHFE